MFSVSRSGGRPREPYRPRSSSIGISTRDSYGVNPRRASSEERKSINSMRRFSGVRNSLSNEPKGTFKDVRPLTDKAYQKKKTAELYEFLIQNDFKPPITHSKLMQPSKKEYEMIFQFLISFFEPTFQVKNLEEDAPRMLKYLAYPFIPSDASFKHVASANFRSFGHLLGVLVFLLDLVKCSLNYDFSKLLLTGDSENPEEHSVLMKYIFDCYPDVNDEEMIGVFEKIVRLRGGPSINDMVQERDMKKEKLKEAQKELENLEAIQKRIEEAVVHIKRYEEYFIDMNKRKEKKEAALLKLTEEVEEKRTKLRNQEEVLSKKQALYDAQGFDGKKHLIHFEELKKELNETLQQKKESLRKLQDECWSLDLEHTKILHKGDELCKDLIHNFSLVKDAVETTFSSLRSIIDPEVQNVCNSFRFEIPACPSDSSQRAFLAWNDTNKESLDGIQKKISTTSIIIKTIISTKSEELTRVEMKKLELSTKLKCSSSAEVQKEHDLANLEKRVVEEVKTLNDKCDKDLSKLEELQNDKREKLDKLSRLQSNLQEVNKIKKSKSEMLLKYKEEQKKSFAFMQKKIEDNLKESEELGLEMVAELEKLVERYKKETQ